MRAATTIAMSLLCAALPACAERTTVPDGGAERTTVPEGGAEPMTVPEGDAERTTVPEGGPEGMTVPEGCVAVTDAGASQEGYARRVKHQNTGIELVLVPAGSFKSGDREITFARPFYVGRTEVTNGQYRRFLAQSGYDGLPDVDPTYDLYLRHFRGKSLMPTGDAFPIVWVSWHNARAFCRWAGNLDLPSDAEWSYCAQAPRPQATDGWIVNNSESHTQEVARRKPNARGIHDLFGNVWEWCLDDHVTDAPLPSDGSARRREGYLTKVMRGGAWSTLRDYAGGSVNNAPANAANDLGFRVVLRLP